MAQNATVVALTGQVLVINMTGTPRILAVGDTLQAGDTIRPAPGASVELALDDGQKMTLGGDQALLLGADVPVAADPAATAAIQAVIATLERGGDLGDIEATAAGLVAGGGGDGSSFVQLLRITEGVTPLAYQYDFAPKDIPPSVTGQVAPLEDFLVPPPPSPLDKNPSAADDSNLATVIVTQGEGVFNGNTQVGGAGEGSMSFESRLAIAHNQNVWMLSDASFKGDVEGQLQGQFTITDQGSGGDPAFVVTPNFNAKTGEAFVFTAMTSLNSGDTFEAEVYKNVDGAWTRVDAIAGVGDNYSYTFGSDGEYRIKFTVGDETGGGGKANATIDVATDSYFMTPGSETVAYQPAQSNIFDNDVLGDGDFSSHDWAFAGGVEAPDGSVTVDGQYGTLVVDPDGDYTYTPDGSGAGTDTFTYTLTDADGDSDTASLSIQVDYTSGGDSAGYTAMVMPDEGGPEMLAASFSAMDDDSEVLSGEDGAYVPNSPDMAANLPESEDFEDAGNNTVRSFNLAHVDDGGDVLDLSEVVAGDDFSAEALDNYLSFGADDDGRAVVTIDPGGDINGDGIPDALQTITFDNVSFADLQAYGGESDIDIIQKLLDNGNLSQDA